MKKLKRTISIGVKTCFAMAKYVVWAYYLRAGSLIMVAMYRALV